MGGHIFTMDGGIGRTLFPAWTFGTFSVSSEENVSPFRSKGDRARFTRAQEQTPPQIALGAPICEESGVELENNLACSVFSCI